MYYHVLECCTLLSNVHSTVSLKFKCNCTEDFAEQNISTNVYAKLWDTAKSEGFITNIDLLETETIVDELCMLENTDDITAELINEIVSKLNNVYEEITRKSFGCVNSNKSKLERLPGLIMNVNSQT